MFQKQWNLCFYCTSFQDLMLLGSGNSDQPLSSEVKMEGYLFKRTSNAFKTWVRSVIQDCCTDFRQNSFAAYGIKSGNYIWKRILMKVFEAVKNQPCDRNTCAENVQLCFYFICCTISNNNVWLYSCYIFEVLPNNLLGKILIRCKIGKGHESLLGQFFL